MENPEFDWFKQNGKIIDEELGRLSSLFEAYFRVGLEGEDAHVEEVEFPYFEGVSVPYLDFINQMELDVPSRVLLILALAPHFRPSLLDILQNDNDKSRLITDFGAVRGQGFHGLLPTVNTFLQLTCAGVISDRILWEQYLLHSHPLVKGHWIKLEKQHANEPFGCSLLIPSRELIDLVTFGQIGEPEFGPSFPAQKIDTEREWQDLILPGDTMSEIQEVLNWIHHEEMVMEQWGLGKKLNPGFRALFYGLPGTGKTFTASLLGKVTGRDVYRIDLSMVVSKYIGETEKNLKVVFDKAQSRGWILFFDEADALFGKRTDVSDSKDRFANQEVSYLLQRVENFDGVVILATNNRENMDKAFTRRFQSVVNFPMPSPSERLRIWESGFPAEVEYGNGVNLSAIANRYEMAGGSIMNVVRHCALRAAVRGKFLVEESDVLEGIRKEFKKAGRLLN